MFLYSSSSFLLSSVVSKITVLFLILLIIFSSSLFLPAFFAPETVLPGFAVGDGTESSASSTEGGEGSQSGNASTHAPGQKDTVIHLREAFDGDENATINVSGEVGSIGILSTYVSGIFRFVSALSVIIAVIVLMAAGFKIMVDGGDTGAREDAKEWIGKVFMGLAFLFLAGVFLKTINPNFYILG